MVHVPGAQVRGAVRGHALERRLRDGHGVGPAQRLPVHVVLQRLPEDVVRGQLRRPAAQRRPAVHAGAPVALPVPARDVLRRQRRRGRQPGGADAGQLVPRARPAHPARRVRDRIATGRHQRRGQERPRVDVGRPLRRHVGYVSVYTAVSVFPGRRSLLVHGSVRTVRPSRTRFVTRVDAVSNRFAGKPYPNR